jgi:hypothetical protein
MVRLIGLLALVAAYSGAAAGPSAESVGAPSDDAPALESTRQTLAKWAETQQIISREKKEWQAGREMLEQRISLIRGEIAALEEKTSGIRENIGEVDHKRQGMISDLNSLESGTSFLKSAIRPLESKTRELLKSLPDPIRERVAPLAQRIPDNPSTAELSLSQRYQNVVGILNEVNKFNRDITVTSEVRRLPGGATAEVTAVYLGLGQAYYVTAKGDGAGIGRPSPNGWEWSPADDLAGNITRVIDILQNQEVPAFVPLPVEIR